MRRRVTETPGGEREYTVKLPDSASHRRLAASGASDLHAAGPRAPPAARLGRPRPARRRRRQGPACPRPPSYLDLRDD